MSRSHFAVPALLYALLIVYSSTIVGPAGPHFVPLDPAQALHRFLATRYVQNGSEQRADWMGNLTMLVPFGFLLTGTLWRGAGRWHPVALVGAASLCFILVLGVKYAQLFFPPRTVTLNYILAQGVGSVLGVGLFAITQGRLAAMLRGRTGALGQLVFLLQAYTAAVILFLLMPLDFALNAADLRMQLDRLPEVVTAVTGEGRPILTRAALILAGVVALVPVGMLLTVSSQQRVVVGCSAGAAIGRRSTPAAIGRGFLLMLGVFVLSTLVISGSPTLVSLLCHTLGVCLGAWFMHWLSSADLKRIRRGLTAAFWWLAVTYFGLLLAVNGLLSTYWVSLRQAVSMAYPLGVLPLFDYYIVTKGEAAKNIVAHVAMYAPIGGLAWLRGRGSAAGPTAALLALCIETARYFRPGLEGDVNAIALAGLSAWCVARVMPFAWDMLADIAPERRVPSAEVTIDLREPAAATPARADLGPLRNGAGEIECYK